MQHSRTLQIEQCVCVFSFSDGLSLTSATKTGRQGCTAMSLEGLSLNQPSKAGSPGPEIHWSSGLVDSLFGFCAQLS